MYDDSVLINYCKIMKKAGFSPDSVLDIGASNGKISKMMSKIWPNAFFVMCEANGEHEPALNQLNASNSSKFKYYIELLGEEEEKEVEFYKTKINDNQFSSGNSRFRELTPEYNDENVIVERLKMRKLDNLPYKKFELIKLDVQGSELAVIKGGIDIVKQAKCLIVETAVVQYNKAAPTQKEVVDFLFALNFIPVDIIEFNTRDGKIIQETLLFVKK